MTATDRTILRLARMLGLGTSVLSLGYFVRQLLPRLGGPIPRGADHFDLALCAFLIAMPLGASLYFGLGVLERALETTPKAARPRPAGQDWKRPPPWPAVIGVISTLLVALPLAHVQAWLGAVAILIAFAEIGWICDWMMREPVRVGAPLAGWREP